MGYRLAIFALIVFTAWCAGQDRPDAGTGGVAGMVVNENGVPVQGVFVSTLPLHMAVHGKVPRGMTDADGRFLVTPIAAGLQMVCIDDPKHVYPDTCMTPCFTPGTKPPVANVVDGEIAREIVVIVRPGRKLRGEVVDADDGKPVKYAQATVMPQSGIEACLAQGGSDGAFELTAPTAPMLLKIEAPGYTSWQFRESDSEPIAPRTVRTFKVMLHRIPIAAP